MPPKIVLITGVGMFACGKTKKEADTAAALFEDAMKIAVYSQSFGGPLPLDAGMSDFIRNWEAESYRSGVSLAGASKARLSGKISIVTGAAQGFRTRYCAGDGKGRCLCRGCGYE